MKFSIVGVTLLAIIHSCVAYGVAIETDIVCPIEQKDDSFVVQYASKVSCNVFYKCNRGVAIKVECSDGLHYNEHIQACDYPSRAKCKLIENSNEVIHEARSLFGSQVEETHAASEEDEVNKAKESHHPKLPQLNNSKKQIESQNEFEHVEEKESQSPKLPQLNNYSKESQEKERPKLPSHNNTKVLEGTEILKQPQLPKDSEEQKKVKAPFTPITESSEHLNLSKQLRVKGKQPLQKPNRVLSSTMEEDKDEKEENIAEIDEKNAKKEENVKKDKAKKKVQDEKENEDKIEDSETINEENTEVKALSVENESLEEVQDLNLLLEDNQPKPVRRTLHDGEQNSDETLKNVDEEGLKVLNASIKNGKEHKTPIDKESELKTLIDIKNKSYKQSVEDEK